jgi:16S rRNA processing protein RimM
VPGRLVVGLVRGVHGLRGMVRVEILSDNEERFAAGSVLFPEGTQRALTITSAHQDGPGLLVRFAEIGSRNAADALREKYLEAEVPDELPAGTFYWHDIVGCAVFTLSGEELGTVTEVFRVGESEIYSVRGPRGEVLIPAVQSVVREMAPAERRIVVDEMALGLADEDETPDDETPDAQPATESRDDPEAKPT